jgi:hypothetical protein
VNEFAIEPEHAAEAGSTQAHPAREDGIENRLYFGLRLADHPEYLSRRRLLLRASALSLSASARRFSRSRTLAPSLLGDVRVHAAWLPWTSWTLDPDPFASPCLL